MRREIWALQLRQGNPGAATAPAVRTGGVKSKSEGGTINNLATSPVKSGIPFYLGGTRAPP